MIIIGFVCFCEGVFGRQQKMRDMGVDKLFQSMLVYSDPNLTEVYVSIQYIASFHIFTDAQHFTRFFWADC